MGMALQGRPKGGRDGGGAGRFIQPHTENIVFLQVD